MAAPYRTPEPPPPPPDDAPMITDDPLFDEDD
jgi:hypothetical protein